MNRLKVVLCIVGVGVLGATFADGREAASPETPAFLPFNAFACQAGPGVPITNGHLYNLDTGTGAMSDLGLPASNGVPLVYIPGSGKLLGWAAVAQTNGPATGALFDLTTFPGVAIGSAVPAGVGRGLARDPTSGKLYLLIYTDDDVSLYEVNPTTAACRFINYQWGITADSLAIDSQGRAFATAVAAEKIFYSVNLITGELTPVGPLNLTGISGDHTQAMCFDGADTLWMITGGTVGTPAKLYNVNTATGQATAIRPLGVSGWYVGLAIVP